MSIKRYRKKPVVVEALLYTGSNTLDVLRFVGDVGVWCSETGLFINTLEGEMHASIGDHIIKGVNGEFYPCKYDIFEKTYEAAE